MRTWEAAYGAAEELTKATGVRHKVYKNYFPNNGWFISKVERVEDAYARTHEIVARRWKFKEKFRLVQYERIGYNHDDVYWGTNSRKD